MEDGLNLWKRYGDTLTEYQEKLFMKHMRLVVWIARKWYQHLPFDDKFQEGCIGLIQAIETFGHMDEAAFSYQAKYAILRAIGKMRSRYTWPPRMIIGIQDKQIIEMVDLGGVTIKRFALAGLVNGLSKDLREIIVYRYGLRDGDQSRTLEELGEALNCSSRWASKLLKQAIRKLRKMVKK